MTIRSISNSAEIVGTRSDNTSTAHGFLHSKGKFTSTDVQGAFYTAAWGISDPGEIVGWHGLTATDSHGFLYGKGTFTTVVYPGSYFENYVAEVNSSGLMVSGYRDPITVNEVPFTWVPCYLCQPRESGSTTCGTLRPQSRWLPGYRQKLFLSNSDMLARPFHTCRTDRVNALWSDSVTS